MKRLCVYFVREKGKKNTDYIRETLEAWLAQGVSVALLADDGAVPDMAGVQRICDFRQAAERAEAAGADEIIVMDDSLMGPIFSLDAMLDKADSMPGDKWILARGAWMAGLRRDCWHDAALTAALMRGQLPAVPELYPTADLDELTDLPMLEEPLKMAKRGCPFFCHEVFHREYDEVLQRTLGHQGAVFYRYLREEARWDVTAMWRFLLRTYHQETLFWNMHLTHVLPVQFSDAQRVEKHLAEHPLALVMHLYYTDKLAESCAFASRFPRQTHVYVTTSSEEKKQEILQHFSALSVASVEVRVIPNRGRDVAALFVGVADLYDKYEYICFFHDKKTLQTKPGSVGLGFAYKLSENLFATRDYVNNVISLFMDNERLGLAAPPPPHHADYFGTLGSDWGPNYRLTRDLARSLGIDAPMAEDRMPMAPLGSCFYFRTAALRMLMHHGWTYEDFPPEPLPSDGTVLHALERIYPFAAAMEGYYPAYILSDRYARIEHTSMRHYVRGYNLLCFKHGIMGYQRRMREALNKRLNGR